MLLFWLYIYFLFQKLCISFRQSDGFWWSGLLSGELFFSVSSFSKSHVSKHTCENIILFLFRTEDVTCIKQWQWRRGLIITAWSRWWTSLLLCIRWWSPTNNHLNLVVMNCTLSSWRMCLKVPLTTFTLYAGDFS